jgi:tRNA (cmo5U34)-methyltransferase
MTDNASSAFSAHAGDYEPLRRQLVPCFEELYGTAVDALELADGAPARVLDLGAGTGLLTRAVRAIHPQCEATLLDGSTAMLQRARQTLGESASYVVGDLGGQLPAGPWDAVISALAIHHLEDPLKRELYARVRETLAPGGVFVNAEQVKGEPPLLQDAYRRWHHRRALELGASARDWAQACERMRFDRLATGEENLSWMRASGLTDVDCLYKDHCFAVLVGRGPLV